MNTTLLFKLYQCLKKVRDGIDKVIEPIAVALMALLVATISFQVLYRFIIVKIFSFSFPFTEEVAIFLMIWSTYLTIAICLKEGMHAAVNILPDRLPYKYKRIIYFILRFLMTVFILFVIIQGIDLASRSFIFKSPTLRLPMTYIYLAPVIGGGLMLFQIFVELLEVVVTKIDPFTTTDNGGK
jgi:TRAP-type C4-dicarboxylate transport system permease small subunit